MFSKRGRVLAFFCLYFFSCGGGPSFPDRQRRIAVLPLENLSGNPEWEWVGPALQFAVASQFAGSRETYALLAPDRPSADQVRPAAVLDGYFMVRGGRLTLRVILRDTAAGRNIRVVESSDRTASNLPAFARSLAGSIGSPVRPVFTANPEAFREYAAALAENRPEARIPALRRAIENDPACGPAWGLLVQSLAAAGDRAGALRAAEAALAGGIKLDPVDQAQVKFLMASVREDRPSAVAARWQLARLLPLDVDFAVQTAAEALLARQFEVAAQVLEQAVQAEPQNFVLWNELAYARAFAGQREQAFQAADRCVSLAPAAANPLDTAGEVRHLLGDFAPAAISFEKAYALDPAFLAGATLLKAAEAHLRLGDVKGAGLLFERYYSEAARNRSDKETLRDQWRQFTGRLPRPPQGPLPSAEDPAAKAAWLLAKRDFRAAEPILRRLGETLLPNADGPVRILLAWVLMETGRDSEAAPLLRLYPPGLLRGHPALVSLAWPLELELRARLAQKAGDNAAAERFQWLYALYGGGRP